MSIQLRPYQAAVLDKLWAWFRANPIGHPIIEACVASGKSAMIAEAIRQALQYPGTRVLMCVGSRELCRQNAERLLQVWPDAPVGIYSAGLKSRCLDKRIIYATIGSVYKRWAELGDISLMMVDECHQISTKDAGMYRGLIKNLHRLCPQMRVIGWTGTAFDGKGVWLHDGADPLFSDICARVTIRELLDAGYLAPLITPPVTNYLKSDGVGVRGGDYILSQLAKKIDTQDLINKCADELVVVGAERQRWFVYGATVEHCHHIKDALRARGVSAEVISAETPHAERDAALSAIKAGALRAIVNVATMTTGIDLPELDLICLMRNTQSPVLYTQILGRGLRKSSAKQDTMVVDFTDTIQRLGPVDTIKGRSRPKSERGDAPFKICDACGARNLASARECIECGEPFPVDEKPRHGATVSAAPVLSTQHQPRIKRHVVTTMQYRYWDGRNGTATMRVDYHGPLMRIASEWICFEHQGYARSKAVAWWGQRAPSGSAIPASIADAVARAPDELRKPSAILVDISKKYPEITGYEFADTDADGAANQPQQQGRADDANPQTGRHPRSSARDSVRVGL